MELSEATHEQVIFSVMHPPLFATLTQVEDCCDSELRAFCTNDDMKEIWAAEKSLLKDLRTCSARTFAKFRDEYDTMFQSSVTQKKGRGRVRFSLEEELDREICRQSRSGPVDMTLTPVSVTVRPGTVFVTWSAALVDDPGTTEVPAAIRANEALGRTARAKQVLERLEDSIKADAKCADEALLFLEEHGFVSEDDSRA